MIDARPLIAAGVPLGPLTGQLVMYRTTGGRAHHATDGCDTVHGRALTRVVVDPTVTAVPICTTCAWSMPAPLENAFNWSTRGATLARAVHTYATVAADPPSADRTVALQQLLTACNQSGGADELGEHARRIGADIGWTLDAQPNSTDVYTTVAVLLCAARQPNEMSTTALAANRDHVQVLVDAFSDLAARVAAGATVDQATAAAVQALAANLPPAPITLAHIPPVARFAGASFASPLEWATAEWAAVRADDLATIGAELSGHVNAQATELAATQWSVGYGHLGGTSTMASLVQVTFPTARIPSEGTILLAVPPRLLWTLGLAVLDTEPFPTAAYQAVVATAAVLYDDFADHGDGHGHDEREWARTAIQAAAAIIC